MQPDTSSSFVLRIIMLLMLVAMMLLPLAVVSGYAGMFML